MKYVKFKGRILIIGCGSVSRCAIPLMIELIDVPPQQSTVLDFMDNRGKIRDSLDKGVNFVLGRVTKDNYAHLLKNHVLPGDLIIDLAWNIDCAAMMRFCRDNDILYVNTSVEDWDPYLDAERNDPARYTLYSRHMELREIIKGWGDNSGATMIFDHGANPGLVSHFTKHALRQIAEKILKEKPKDERRLALEAALNGKYFAKLAQLTGVKVIHVSERDSQITDRPKQMNEFVNTWSIEGFFEEGVAPVEIGWGTHERYLPRGAYTHKTGPGNQICLNTLGIKTWVRSWVPSGQITGMVIRHGEAFSISDRLTVWEDDVAVYRPTVCYAYCPCDGAVNSLHELEMREFKLQEKQRIMTAEIIGGRDELGVLLMGHDFTSWWCGSTLDVHAARKLAGDGQQATVLQVAVSVVAAAVWAIKNPWRGFLLPDDIDHEEILKICIPYIKPFVSAQVDWTPLKTLNTKFTRFDLPQPEEEDVWQFSTFMADHRERVNTGVN
ncbi:MAG: saccharopine dehydrogenase C-terminal domain-containing protein [Candidatus Margulisbacteria bacterium]|nr:saccharopine dehydrogenase C-terminal domain-containing protein [Candidatus Margulisiibacteriota bacterium]